MNDSRLSQFADRDLSCRRYDHESGEPSTTQQHSLRVHFLRASTQQTADRITAQVFKKSAVFYGNREFLIFYLKRPLFVPLLSHMNLPSLFKIYFNITFLSTRSSTTYSLIFQFYNNLGTSPPPYVPHSLHILPSLSKSLRNYTAKGVNQESLQYAVSFLIG